VAKRVRWGLVPGICVGLCALIVSGCAPCGFHFDVVADMRGYTPPEHPGEQYFAGVCRAIQAAGPGDFIVVPGDLDPPERVRATLDAELGTDYVWYPVVGNHELERPEDMVYLRAINADGATLPGIVHQGPPGTIETCYSFDHESAHFVVLNQYYDGQTDAALDGDVCDALLAWLAEDLAANTKPIVFVLGHEPTVAVGDLSNGRVRHRGDSLDKYPEHNHAFWSLLRQHNVVAYICGHTHNTSVAKVNGVWQIDAGHARGLGDKGTPSTFVKVFVEPDGVRCRVYRGDKDARTYRPVFEETLR